ncbi:MAG: metallophosphoesterase [Treponema sp.]|nr:metallophosphoesterase [Treponema sp.]
MSGKKLLVFSDSHGSISVLKAIFKWANERIPPNGNICAAVCLGDGLSDIQIAAKETGFYSDWKIVLGNNDYGISAPEAAVFELAEHRFFICHGHRYNLYGGYNTLLAAAKHNDADAVLFGHSHVPLFKNINGTALINPGSAGRPRSRTGSSFAVIECIEDKPLLVEFFGIYNNGSIRKIKI